MALFPIYNITDKSVAIVPEFSRHVTLNKGDYTYVTDAEYEFILKAQPGIELLISKTKPVVKEEIKK